MDYINAEEFFKQSKEVRKVFLEWWIENKKKFDIYFEPKVDYETEEILMDQLHYADYYTVPINQVRCLGCYPAFQEAQIRRFIEQKTEEIINQRLGCESGIRIKVDLDLREEGYQIKLCQPYDCKGHLRYHIYTFYETKTADLLQAYWKVAIEIARECLN